MAQKLIAPGLALIILFGTACTIEGSGSQRELYKGKNAVGSGDASAEADGEPLDEEAAACLKLAEKRNDKLRLQDEEEVVEEEASDGCEEVSAEEEVVEEEAAEVE